MGDQNALNDYRRPLVSELNRRSALDRVTNANNAALNDPGREPTPAPDGIVAPYSEVRFHPAAWRAVCGRFENDGANAKCTPLQGMEVDTARDEVSAQEVGRDREPAKEGGNCIDVFGCNQGDLSRPIAFSVKVVANDALMGQQRRAVHNHHSHASRWPQPDPLELTRSYRPSDQLCDL